MVKRQFYTVEELAEMTGLTTRTIQKWTVSRDPDEYLRSYQPGTGTNSKIAVKIEDWEEYLQRHQRLPRGEDDDEEETDK